MCMRVQDRLSLVQATRAALLEGEPSSVSHLVSYMFHACFILGTYCKDGCAQAHVLFLPGSWKCGNVTRGGGAFPGAALR